MVLSRVLRLFRREVIHEAEETETEYHAICVTGRRVGEILVARIRARTNEEGAVSIIT